MCVFLFYVSTFISTILQFFILYNISIIWCYHCLILPMPWWGTHTHWANTPNARTAWLSLSEETGVPGGKPRGNKEGLIWVYETWSSGREEIYSSSVGIQKYSTTFRLLRRGLKSEASPPMGNSSLNCGGAGSRDGLGAATLSKVLKKKSSRMFSQDT